MTITFSKSISHKARDIKRDCHHFYPEIWPEIEDIANCNLAVNAKGEALKQYSKANDAAEIVAGLCNRQQSRLIDRGITSDSAAQKIIDRFWKEYPTLEAAMEELELECMAKKSDLIETFAAERLKVEIGKVEV